MSKFWKILSYLLGIGAIVGGVALVIEGKYLEAILSFLLSFVIFTPLTNIITFNTQHPKLARLFVVLAIVLIAGYIGIQRDKERQESKDLKPVVNVLKQAAKSYCLKHKSCASNMEEVYKEYPMPFTKDEINKIDWSKLNYDQIDGGKDCVVSVILPSGNKYAELCIGENLEYIKYLQ